MRRNLFPIIVAATVAGMCLAITMFCVLSSTLQASRIRPVPLGDLIVSPSLFPQGWAAVSGPEPLSSEVDIGADETLEIGFRYRESYPVALHEVYRFKNEFRAMYMLYLARGADFSRTLATSEWKTPAGWTYHSPIASDFEFACAEIDMGARRTATLCIARARYGEFASIFSAPLGVGNMTLQDMERLLRDIDTKMAKYLK